MYIGKVSCIVLTIVVIALFPMKALSSTANWIDCGTEDDGECAVYNPLGNIILLRYGAISPNNNPRYYYTYITKTGVDAKLKCSNWMGNTLRHVNKQCSYQILDDPPFNPKGFTYCAPQGDLCRLPSSNTPYLIRYGYEAGTTFVYGFQSDSFLCNNDTMLVNITKNKLKACTYLPLTKQKIGDEIRVDSLVGEFKTCASEGQYCNVDSNRAVVIRYGSTKYWTYRIANINRMFCNETSFDYSPTTDPKVCEYAEIVPDFPHGITGEWKEIANCNGQGGCGALSQSLKIGIINSSSKTTTHAIQPEVTASFKLGMIDSMLEFFKLKDQGNSDQLINIGVKAAYTYTNSSSFQSSLSQNTDVTVNCPSTEGASRLYQFILSGDNNCFIEGGTCPVSLNTVSYICASWPAGTNPTEMEAPQCLPNQCTSGTNCNLCWGKRNPRPPKANIYFEAVP